ncbi:tetratricopeptide repeat protein [Falsiroseomonas sp. E2-1-a20]|uniref:tetratricopeptide repeat protein n=1 Tax=Falsiroseomonas sp. E2-1-a20 TaxID=3239300 RepID=UPI003F2F1490
MMLRAALVLLLLAPPALAQPAARTPAETRQAQLDQLFEALKAAPDTQGGQLVEARIRALWSRAVSPAAALLLQRGVRNIQSNATADALEDFDAALVLEPGAADGWLLRAQAYARLGDTAAAARDLQEALRLEPRHFGALVQLSQLQEETGDLRGALRSLDAALALHPKLPGGDQRRRELVRRVEGVAL